MTNPNQGPNHYPSLPTNMYSGAQSQSPFGEQNPYTDPNGRYQSTQPMGFTAPAARPSRNWVPILCILAVILAMLIGSGVVWADKKSDEAQQPPVALAPPSTEVSEEPVTTTEETESDPTPTQDSSSPAQNNSPRYQQRQQPRQQTHTTTQRKDYPAGLSANGWDGISGAQCNGGEAVYAAKKSAPQAHVVICDEGSGLVYRGNWSSGPAVGTASGSGTSYTATFNDVSQLLINGSEFTIIPDSTSYDSSKLDTGQFSTVWSAN